MIFYKFRRKIVKTILHFFDKIEFVKGINKLDLLIYDDIFPHPVSGFRYEEFRQLIEKFNKSKIFVEPLSYQYVDSPIELHKIHVKEFKANYPNLKSKLIFKNKGININAKLFYCVFLNNIYTNLIWLEKYKIPFVFTLYPGAGFELENEESNQKLQKVLSSIHFRKVIVTQQCTKDYLLKNNFCSNEKIEFIFGCVVPQISLITTQMSKELFPKKATFDIVFCAAKYMPKGLDKGYDVFIDLAHSLSKKYDFVRFHIIGGFNSEEIDVSLLGETIKFYGYQKFNNLADIYSKVDIIVSPNRPFMLGKGAFDGFPLGTVVEAVLNGVVAIVTDDLKQNTVFDNKTEIIIVENKVAAIESEIINLIQNPSVLRSRSALGRNKFLEIYSNNYQMNPRIDILQKEIIKK